MRDCYQTWKNNPDVLVLCARGWIAMRESEKKWFKKAENLLKNAMKSHEGHEPALYYLGEINLYRLNFSGAENYFRKVVEKKGEYMGKADDKWNLSQKIIRAMPGTLAGKKVALHEKITRADLSILFVEELKVGDLFAMNMTDISSLELLFEENLLILDGISNSITMQATVRDANGNPVTGSVDFELIEALDNKDMLMLNRPTVTNNGELLISGGIIYINARSLANQWNTTRVFVL